MCYHKYFFFNVSQSTSYPFFAFCFPLPLRARVGDALGLREPSAVSVAFPWTVSPNSRVILLTSICLFVVYFTVFQSSVTRNEALESQCRYLSTTRVRSPPRASKSATCSRIASTEVALVVLTFLPVPAMAQELSDCVGVVSRTGPTWKSSCGRRLGDLCGAGVSCLLL